MTICKSPAPTVWTRARLSILWVGTVVLCPFANACVLPEQRCLTAVSTVPGSHRPVKRWPGLSTISNHNPPSPVSWVPFPWMRKQVEGIEVEHIDRLEFSGELFTIIDINKPIVVRDPALMEKFVQALRGAVVPKRRSGGLMEPPAGAITKHHGALTIFLKSGTGAGPREPLEFVVNPLEGREEYGPEFAAALRALEVYEGERIRTMAQKVKAGGQLSAVYFSTLTGAEVKIEDPTFCARLVDALSQADHRAYACSGQKARWRPVTRLVLRDGSTIVLNLILLRPDAQAPSWLRTLDTLLEEDRLKYSGKD